MATIIKLKGSAVPNLAPSVNDLSYKEVARLQLNLVHSL